MTLKVKLDGKKTIASLDYVSNRYLQNAQNYVDRLGSYFAGQVQKSMQPPKSGEVYGNHRASAPGEAPAIDSSQLVNSIQFVKTGRLTGKVFTNVKYAEILEVQKNRPFMGKDSKARKNTERQARALLPLLEVKK